MLTVHVVPSGRWVEGGGSAEAVCRPSDAPLYKKTLSDMQDDAEVRTFECHSPDVRRRFDGWVGSFWCQTAFPAHAASNSPAGAIPDTLILSQEPGVAFVQFPTDQIAQRCISTLSHADSALAGASSLCSSLRVWSSMHG